MFFGSVVGTAGGGGGGGIPAPTYTTLSFDGLTDYLNCGGNASLDLDDGVKSHSIWFKTASASTQQMYNQGNESTGPYYDIYIESGTIVARTKDGSSNTRSYKTPTSVYNDDVWHHLVVLWNSFGTFQIYIDNVDTVATIVGTDAIVGNVLPTEDLTVGIRLNTTSQYFSGSLASIKMLDLTLSTAQITELYNAGTPKVHRAYSSGIRDNAVLAIEGAEDLPTTQLETDLAAVTGLQLRSQANSGFNDISANAFTGTDNGSIVVNTDTLNVKDEWDFVPTDYLSYATDPAFEFAHTDSFSIVVAFNSDSITGSNQFLVAKAANSGQYEGYYLVTNASTQKVRMILQNNSGFTTIEAQGSTVLVNDKYYVATMTYDGSNAAAGIQLYINGVAESMSTLSNVAITSMTNSLPLIIGSRDGGGVPFDGQISEAMVFSKELTATEVRTVSDLLIERYLPKQDLEGNIIAENGTPTLTGAAIEFSEVQS